MSKWNVGDRVQISIKRASEWHRDAHAAMQGKVGTVEAVKSTYGRTDNYVLVRFDAPLEPWHANSRPVSGHHFDDYELSPEKKEEEVK